ncbi:hypothetical protein [Stakelama marina]|uniref:Uncharacterized protein n=1 Tax=Stakelama marina TaxID=2826939 RepID=A0A8T4IGY8_9SPHN|nr:hypothetical protein [Stakelama marina]MBR0553761.1 hypothetical protein [Stakelama marina]
MLQRTDLLASDVDAELSARIARRVAAVLGHRDAIPTRIRAASGFAVVALKRHHGRLLVEIEQRDGDLLRWTYRERSRNHCMFACRGDLLAVAIPALVGKSLAALADPGFAVSDTRIQSIEPCSDGWIEACIDPGWQQF